MQTSERTSEREIDRHWMDGEERDRGAGADAGARTGAKARTQKKDYTTKYDNKFRVR